MRQLPGTLQFLAASESGESQTNGLLLSTATQVIQFAPCRRHGTNRPAGRVSRPQPIAFYRKLREFAAFEQESESVCRLQSCSRCVAWEVLVSQQLGYDSIRRLTLHSTMEPKRHGKRIKSIWENMSCDKKLFGNMSAAATILV